MAKRSVVFTYPEEMVKEPVIHNLGEWFKIITNIRRAEVTEYRAWVVMDLEGEERDIDEGISWAASQGIKVDLLSEVEVSVRPMALRDLDAIFSIDHDIRVTGGSSTYNDLTTRHVFEMDKDETHPEKRPSISKVAALVELGFVAEVAGQVCGFILGRQIHLKERAAEVGEIIIFGVQPNHWRKGIASQLVDSICQEFRSRGVRIVRTAIDPSDKDLLAFFERTGFSGARFLNYEKSL